MFGIEKDFQQLMEQVYGPHYGLGRKVEEESVRIAKELVDNAVEEVKKMDEPVKYETPMTENEEEIEKVKAQIKVLEKKLSFLEELEKTKSPVEEAYKRWVGQYPPTGPSVDAIDLFRWRAFQMGYNAAQKDYKVGEYQESEELMEKLGFVKNSDGNWTAQPLVETAQEPAKDVVSLYERFVNEGAYDMTSFENALRVVNDFLLDEGVIEDESGEYITFTLQKSLLEIPNA